MQLGLEPAEVTLPRRHCKLTFPATSCVAYDPAPMLPSAAEVAAAAAPKPLVLLVKLGVSSPFEGDRKTILTTLVRDVCGHGGVQLVFLVDRSEWTKVGRFADASDALPSAFKPLVVGYSISEIQRVFPTKTLKPRAESPTTARARAIGKYYETYSWSWWWEKHGRASGVAQRVWVAEDDTVFRSALTATVNFTRTLTPSLPPSPSSTP